MGKGSYWNGDGKHQSLADKLGPLIPGMGSIKGGGNAKLEVFRQAANAYYDLYNNGGENRGDEIRAIFGISKSALDKEDIDWEKCFERTEPVMDALILDAAKEQGLTP